MEFLNPERTLATYEAHSGEQCFLAWRIDTISPEQPGFSSAITCKEIAEAVFVAGEDAALTELLVANRSGWASMASLLAANGVAFRLPGGIGATPVHLPDADVTADHPSTAGALRRVA